MLSHFFRKMHLSIYIFWVVFFFALFYPILYFASKKPKRYFFLIVKIRRIIASISSFLSGFYFKFTYTVPVDWSKTYVICANHTSILDISIMSILCRQGCCFIGKDTLLRNPITRIFFKTIDIAINRESKLSSYKGFKEAHIRLTDQKSVVIFPEGKIDDCYPPVLQSFKNGPFRLAIENKVAILPVILQDIWKMLWDEGQKGSRPGCGQVTILAPIETAHLTIADLDSLKDQVYALYSKALA